MHLKITKVNTTINGIIIWYDKDHTFIPWTEIAKYQKQYFDALAYLENKKNEEE